MAGSLTFALSLFLFVPIATGLKCHQCSGHTKGGGYNGCVAGKTFFNQTCPKAPHGQIEKCAKITGKVPEGEAPTTDLKKRSVEEEIVGTLTQAFANKVAEWIKTGGNDKTEFTIQGCTSVPEKAGNGCEKSSYYKKFTKNRSHTRCYCDSDYCNGQTTLVSSIISSFIGLVIYYVL